MSLQPGSIPMISPQSKSYFLSLVVPNLVFLFNLAFGPSNIKSYPFKKFERSMVPR